MRIGIYGYGNLGKGVEIALSMHEDMELVGVFTRRDPSTLHTVTGAKTYSAASLADFKGKIDCLIVCGGSATDLPVLTPMLAKDFNLIDSFDTHKNIPVHFEKVNAAAAEGKNLALISAGWDPGLFSIARLYGASILPNGKDYTFWGRGVSQGHSDAIRRIPGVVDARQYTVPIESALSSVRAGENPELSTGEKHKRECYVVIEEGADPEKIATEIKTMPNYFADYDTEVHFISLEELRRDHAAMPHGGSVIRGGTTGKNGENRHVIEYSLKLDSNPEFTASVLVAYARAIVRMRAEGKVGAISVFDVPPAQLSALSREELLEKML
jgi:diaminopimelate dehydrogenase